MITANYDFHKLVFNLANHNLVEFLGELQRLAKSAYGVAALAINEQLSYAKRRQFFQNQQNKATFKMADIKKV